MSNFGPVQKYVHTMSRKSNAFDGEVSDKSPGFRAQNKLPYEPVQLRHEFPISEITCLCLLGCRVAVAVGL
jgi:predicted metal-binding protein